jgi:hypothetical protein
MALDAFLAGLLLAESNFELEADIEPFRGLLLALLLMSIGMTIDMTVVRRRFRPARDLRVGARVRPAHARGARAQSRAHRRG